MGTPSVFDHPSVLAENLRPGDVFLFQETSFTVKRIEADCFYDVVVYTTSPGTPLLLFFQGEKVRLPDQKAARLADLGVGDVFTKGKTRELYRVLKAPHLYPRTRSQRGGFVETDRGKVYFRYDELGWKLEV